MAPQTDHDSWCLAGSFLAFSTRNLKISCPLRLDTGRVDTSSSFQDQPLRFSLVSDLRKRFGRRDCNKFFVPHRESKSADLSPPRKQSRGSELKPILIRNVRYRSLWGEPVQVSSPLSVIVCVSGPSLFIAPIFCL